MTSPELFSRTLMVQGPDDTLARFAKAFRISTAYVLEMDVEDGGDYLDHHAPALIHTRIKGDFTYFIEPMLWDITQEHFHETLLDLSARDLAIALPDEDAKSPFQYVLFLNGETQIIDIDEDDVFDENFVIGNLALRKHLAQIAPLAV